MPQKNMDRFELISEIEKVFGSVKLGEGIGVLEAMAIDHCVSDKQRLIARKSDFRESWKAIPSEVIEDSYSALCFVDTKGMLFCLPAFMVFALRSYDSNTSLSVDAPIYALLANPTFVESDMHDYFKPEHLSLMAKFLRYMVLEAGDEYVDADAASQAYEKIWGGYDQ